MKITRKWLEKFSACTDGKEWYLANCSENPIEGIEGLMKGDKYDWANWLIVRCLTHKQNIKYAIFAAEQVIDIFKKKYPDDKRPRQAIESARLVLEHDTAKNRAAADAASAADAAANAAYAAYAADAAANVSPREMQIKILEYGIGLLNKGVK